MALSDQVGKVLPKGCMLWKWNYNEKQGILCYKKETSPLNRDKKSITLSFPEGFC